MKVKFLETRKVKAEEGETFEAGKAYELADASAERWIRRGVAVAVTDEDPAPKKGDKKPLGKA